MSLIPTNKLVKTLYDRIDFKLMASMDLWPLNAMPDRHQTIKNLLFGRYHDKTEISLVGNSVRNYGGKSYIDSKSDQFLYNISETEKRFNQQIADAVRSGILINFWTSEDELVFKPVDFLFWFQKKGYPLPEGLINSFKKGNLKETQKILKQLRKGFHFFIMTGEAPKIKKPDKKKKFKYGEDTDKGKKERFKEAFLNKASSVKNIDILTKEEIKPSDWYIELLEKAPENFPSDKTLGNYLTEARKKAGKRGPPGRKKKAS
jgi:hypothetical protein